MSLLAAALASQARLLDGLTRANALERAPARQGGSERHVLLEARAARPASTLQGPQVAVVVDPDAVLADVRASRSSGVARHAEDGVQSERVVRAAAAGWASPAYMGRSGRSGRSGLLSRPVAWPVALLASLGLGREWCHPPG